jgi:NADP-dependent 3-hydroxy acid dehydrogenase YdfG
MSQPSTPQFPAEDASKVNAFERIHQQMAAAHMATQRALADNHAAYLRASEIVLRLAAGQAPPPAGAPLDLPEPTADVPLDLTEPTAESAPTPPPPPEPAESRAPAPEPIAEALPAPDIAPPFEPAPPEEPIYETAFEPAFEPAIAQPEAAPHVEPDAVAADAPGEPIAHEWVDEQVHEPVVTYASYDDEPMPAPEPIANEPLWYEPAMPELATAPVIEEAAPPETVIEDVFAVPPETAIAAPVADNLPVVQLYEPAQAEPLTPAIDYIPPPPAQTWPAEPPTIDYLPDAIPEPEPAPPALRRLALVAREEAPPGAAMPGLRAGSRVLLSGGPDAIRAAIGQALTAAGLELATGPTDLDALISLHALTDHAGPQAGAQAALAAFAAVQAVALQPPAAFIALQNGGGDFGLSGAAPRRAWTAGFAAFTRTVAREWPHCATKTIDIDDQNPERLAMRLTRELVFGGAGDMVGLTADNRRLVPRETALAQAEAGRLDLDNDAVIIVSGGARGVTAACLAALCHGRRLRLTLLGRTLFDPAAPADDHAESPGAMRERLLSEAAAAGQALSPAELLTALGDIRAQREVRESIAQLADAGADIRYFAIDINAAAAVAAAVERTRNEFGRIDGVIHAAGIIADRRIADKTEAQFARVFSTKVEGLANLLAATAEDPLRLLVMFGSLAGRYGNLGQADYALANATLAAVARAEAARRGAGCLVKSIAWGPWDGGMLDASLNSSFARHDVAAAEQAAGAAAFLAELAQPAGDVAATDIVFAPAAEETTAYSDAAQ